jgi:hypothetical protein
MSLLTDRKFRSARQWSNMELRKFSKNLKGKVVNVSAWKDMDKEGSYYKEYFTSAEEYFITNWKDNAKGFQGNSKNEYFLNLEDDHMPSELLNKFDVVFNHTTLEHVFEIDNAFKNLCLLSKDMVITVVPFLQEQHIDTGFQDYWRFTPQAIKKLYEKNNFELIYINFNDQKKSSIYVFGIGVKNKDKFQWVEKNSDNKLKDVDKIEIGKLHFKNSIFYKLLDKFK